MENEAEKEYNKLTTEELQDLNYTGEWRLDKKRFVKEYEKNNEIFNLTDLDYGDF